MKYIEPNMELIAFEIADVVRTSDIDNTGEQKPDIIW